MCVLSEEETGFDKVFCEVVSSCLGSCQLVIVALSSTQNDPSKYNDFSKYALHGEGDNIWFDKSFNIIIFKNGKVYHEIS